MAVDLSHFQESFFEESAEHVETMETGLLDLEQRPTDLDLLNRIFRAAHSIKGNAGMFSFTAISGLTHKMENVLDKLRNSQMVVTKDIIDLLLQALDGLKSLLDAARGNGEIDVTHIAALEARLVDCFNGGDASPSTAQAAGVERASSVTAAAGLRTVTISWRPLAELFQRGLDPSQLFRELATLGKVLELDVHVDVLPDLATMDAERCYLSWTLVVETDKPVKDLDAVFDFVRDGSELQITDQNEADDEYKPLGEILVDEGAVSPEQVDAALAKQKPLGQILVEEKAATPQQINQALSKQQQMKKAESASIRVDTEKIDKLINLVGELVITQSMITDLGEKFTMSQLPVLQERIIQLERNTRELQERVMSVRMVPIGATAFNRFPRLVRDLASKSGKKIQLLMSGEETELDKTLIEAIGDPLTHLVRNSADHGLEGPEERVAAGKSELGTIRLNAYHDGGSICITVEDDGRGLNRSKILKKAVEKGLIIENNQLSDDEVWQLIFRPGFSTAETITDISGRGVGMDVVKRNIEALGGSVAVQSNEGKGSKLTLKLPLTLAIIDGMTVRVANENYIIPLISVTESIRPKLEDLQTVVGKGEVVNLRGEWVPMVRLYDVFGVEAEFTNPAEALLVIVEAEGKRVALFVDELTGQQQVVIKSLEQNYEKVEGISGATILGDGQVALILDITGLVKLSRMAKTVAA
ncbi:MAG: chemotaxis protein CheA [Nitrospirales bacterium]|nr:chemotaxis protein CheA [Nitrospira sp.]MDR4502299.1 chemotaxis protein CheA [Nitrospirales bacterium]